MTVLVNKNNVELLCCLFCQAALEQKQGISNLELVCKELQELEQAEEQKREQKRRRKKRNKKKSKADEDSGKVDDEDEEAEENKENYKV